MISLFHKISDATARTITKEYSTSFSIAVRLLSPSIRQAIYNIYGFVRVADEIVDSFQGYQQEDLLNRFEDDYRHAVAQGISTNPVLHAFQLTIKKYNIDEELITAFLKSMRADLTKEVYTHQSEINEYIYGSADVVGLMSLKVFVKGNQHDYELLKKPAMKLGAAFQKVNFLRDLNHDYSTLNRSYFPNVNPEQLTEHEKQQLVSEIEAEFKEAYAGIMLLPSDAKFGVYVAYSYYYLLLLKIKKTPANCLLEKRIRISNPAKFAIMAKSYFQYYLKLV